MKLHTELQYDNTYACFDDNYDGAPDAGRQLVGTGRTDIEAVRDYLEQLEDRREDARPRVSTCPRCGQHGSGPCGCGFQAEGAR